VSSIEQVEGVSGPTATELFRQAFLQARRESGGITEDNLVPLPPHELGSDIESAYEAALARRAIVHQALSRLGLHEAYTHDAGKEPAIHWTLLAWLSSKHDRDTHGRPVFVGLVLSQHAVQGKSILSLVLENCEGPMVYQPFVAAGAKASSDIIREVTPGLMAALGVHEEAIAAFCYQHDDNGRHHGIVPTTYNFDGGVAYAQYDRTGRFFGLTILPQA
jgi:hypothetical protein